MITKMKKLTFLVYHNRGKPINNASRGIRSQRVGREPVQVNIKIRQGTDGKIPFRTPGRAPSANPAVRGAKLRP